MNALTRAFARGRLYNAKGNLVSGNGLTITYTSYNKTATITRGTIAFHPGLCLAKAGLI